MLSGRKGKLFGTDGIRGKSNSFPIRPDIVLKVGQALAYLLKKNCRNKKAPMVLIGKDTRLSGYMLEQALASGLNSMGVWVQLTGPLPTPGIGFLAQNMRAEAGIVISASHNPYYDNGIKFFDANGFKMSKKREADIEELVFSNKLNQLIASCDRIGRSRRIDDSAGRYIVHVKNTFPLNMTLDGMRVVLDCAHGACYKVAPKIFEELGAEVFVIGNKPTGYNINENMGALHPDKIQQAVLDYKADVGISLDGDGDRVIMADEKGKLVNGDHILGICALSLQKKGELKCPKVVATSMSNMGLDTMLKKKGIQVERAEPGDRNVVEHMRKNNISLGGEPSGHIIFLNQSTTGDACVAALNVLAVMRTENKKLSELSKVLVSIPQVQKSVKIKKRKELHKITGYNKMIEDIKTGLKNKGRICVRYSGTESVIRVLVEGKDKKLIQNYADKVTTLLSRQLNPSAGVAGNGSKK